MIWAILAKNWRTAVFIALAAAVLVAWQWDRHAQFVAGRDAERMAARERAMELIEKRAKDNAEISDMDAAALCRELGGRWVSDRCN